jgi:peroxiredoxin
LEQFSRLHAKQFKRAGISLFAVSADPPKFLLALQRKYKLRFPLLSDPKLQTIRQYRTEHWGAGIALSSMFIIDATGRIRWQKIAVSTFAQPNIDDLINALQILWSEIKD